MTGQTSGQLLRVLDKLGIERRESTPAVSTGANVPSLDQERHEDAPALEDEAWYQDSVYESKLEWIILQHARRRGLPIPGSPAYSRAPWAVDVSEWIAEQREKASAKGRRPLAVLEHGYPVDNVVLLRG
jgi:hypothetical protein